MARGSRRTVVRNRHHNDARRVGAGRYGVGLVRDGAGWEWSGSGLFPKEPRLISAGSMTEFAHEGVSNELANRDPDSAIWGTSPGRQALLLTVAGQHWKAMAVTTSIGPGDTPRASLDLDRHEHSPPYVRIAGLLACGEILASERHLPIVSACGQRVSVSSIGLNYSHDLGPPCRSPRRLCWPGLRRATTRSS